MVMAARHRRTGASVGVGELIIEKLRKDGPCSLNDVALHLSPFYSWEQISLAVDRMSRDGRL